MDGMPSRKFLGFGAAAVGVTFAIYFFLYVPLIRNLSVHSHQCLALESEAAQARARALSFRSGTRGRGLISEREVAEAIDELTREGNLKGVEFVSLTPGEPRAESGRPFRTLPVETEIKSTYENLGKFLGSLDELQTSVMTVADLATTLDPVKPPYLRTRLTLHLHLKE